MVEQLDKNISDIKDKIQESTERLGSESLMTADTPFSAALDELSKIKKKFDDYTKRANTYSQYQEILDVNPTTIKEIEDFTKKYDLRYKLWKSRETFTESSKHWYNDFFLELDAQEIVG